MADSWGHVKISRKAYETDAFWLEEREFSRWEAWEYLLQKAAFATHRKLVGGVVVTIPRGAVLASERTLADDWSWSRGRVRRFLDLLADMERVALKPAHQAAHVPQLIILCNYDTYQSSNAVERPTDSTTDGTTGGTTPGPRPAHARPTPGPSIKQEYREAGNDVGKIDDVGGSAENVDELDPDDFAALAIRAVNRAMAENPNLTDDVQPILESHPTSNQQVHDWLGLRIPRATILETVYQEARGKSDGPVYSLRYFDQPVRREHAKVQAEQSETLKHGEEQRHYDQHRNGAAQRGRSELRRVGEGDRAVEEARAAVDRWIEENPDDAEALLEAVRAEVIVEAGGEGKFTEKVVEATFRTRARQRAMSTPTTRSES